MLSADLFGMTTTNAGDLGIGQVLGKTLPYFDYVDPMVYPSHYPATFLGYENPADHPYEVIKYSLDKGIAKAVMASSSPEKLRPWLQDFNLGAVYTANMVRELRFIIMVQQLKGKYSIVQLTVKNRRLLQLTRLFQVGQKRFS